MLERHITRDGRRIVIAEMGDTHLENTIKIFLRNIIGLKRQLAERPLSEYDAILYGATPVDSASAAKANRTAFQRLYPYLAELLLRGTASEEVIEMLREAAGRSEALRIVEVGGLLPQPDYDDDDYGDEWERDF